MRPLRNRTLQTRIVRITREQRHQLRLPLEPRIVRVEIAEGLEAGDATHWFGGAASDGMSRTRLGKGVSWNGL